MSAEGEVESGNLGGHYALLSEQIRALSEAVHEIKSLVGSLDGRTREIELGGVTNRAVCGSRIDASHRRLDLIDSGFKDLDLRVSEIEDKMPFIDDVLALRKKLFVLVFVSGFVGTSFAGLFIAMMFNFLFKELL